MSFVAALAGAAIVARPLQAAKVFAKLSSGTCTAVGALTITGFGLGVAPYVKTRAPLDLTQRQALLEDFTAVVGPPPASKADTTSQGWQFRLSFEDLRNPWLFHAFTQACRTVFAAYADATGVMTPFEFRCALHKMIDITWTWYSQDGSWDARAAQALAVRKLLGRVADGAFKVIDEDDDGSICVAEFTGAVLLVLAVANGKAAGDAPILQRLAFRIVDADGDGVVSERELQRWVELALEYGTAPANAQFEPRGPWGIFGTRVLTPARLTRKWFRAADLDQDGALSQEEFASLATSLQMHELIHGMARRFAIS
mmetsp:Transcript_86975/g.221468  ORF Transcript_86975/g.221468 Transcript_86975/m.221468 type:complete len:313 (+) Transcript_86975:81-1019(+)